MYTYTYINTRYIAHSTEYVARCLVMRLVARPSRGNLARSYTCLHVHVEPPTTPAGDQYTHLFLHLYRRYRRRAVCGTFGAYTQAPGNFIHRHSPYLVPGLVVRNSCTTGSMLRNQTDGRNMFAPRPISVHRRKVPVVRGVKISEKGSASAPSVCRRIRIQASSTPSFACHHRTKCRDCSTRLLYSTVDGHGL